jgi:UDP-glucose 4-epimerase
MRVLITGGFGFVGGRLAQHLQQIGHNVVLGSRSVRSAPDRGLPGASVAVVDWANIEALKKICDGVDVVIQAAGMNARECEAHPREALEVNGLNTARLLEAAIAVDVGRFVYLSTAHVYASPLVGSISESSCPRNLHPYATSHLAGENPVLRAGMEGLIEGVVVRLSNAFGAPVHKDVNCWGLLMNDLCKQSVENGQIKLRSSGAQQRDFIAMTEVCGVLERLCLSSIRLPQPGIVNLGSGVSQSVLEMAQLVQLRCKQVLGFEPELRRPPGLDERNKSLYYGADRLADMGIQVKPDNRSEIDGLLMFCQATYKNPRSQL